MKIVETQCRNCSVSGVRVYEMRHVDDPVRGHLTAGEFGRELPFAPQRFITYDIPAAQIRVSTHICAVSNFSSACTVAAACRWMMGSIASRSR